MSAKASKAMKGKTTRRAKVKGRKAKKAAAPATSRGASRTSQAKALPQLPPAEQRRWSLFSASRSKPLVPEVLDRDGQAVPKDQAPSVVRYLQGCVTARVRDGGLVQPERFSAAQLDYLHSVGRGHRADATAGVCLAFSTRATCLSLEVEVLQDLSHDAADARLMSELLARQEAQGRTKLLAEEGAWVPRSTTAPAAGLMDGLGLEAGGRFYGARVESGTAEFELDNPDRALTTCRLWLPSLMSVAVGNLRANDRLEPLAPAPLLLCLGDSITQGFMAGSPAHSLGANLARELGCQLLNQGISGHVFDDETLKGMSSVRQAAPALVTVAYGTNDWAKVASAKEIRTQARRYLERLTQLFDPSTIFVISPLWRADKDVSASGKPLGWVRKTLKKLCDDMDISYVDGKDLVPHDPLYFGDGRLHPNAAGYLHYSEGVLQALAAARFPASLQAVRAGKAAPQPGLAPFSAAGAAASEPSLEAQVDAVSQERPGAPQTHPDFDALVRTIWRLRQPDGCPWDREQTHASIKKNMVEEAYEAVDAIEAADDAHLQEELGDVLMQVLLHAQIAQDDGAFGIDDVLCGLNAKLVRRHPHVFGAQDASNPEEVLSIWETVKSRERAKAQAPQGLLDSVPRALPALMECQKISKRAARAGFDWDSPEAVWDKVDEERAEYLAEPQGSAAVAVEFGDLLFALVNVGRKAGIDCEEALRASNAKFRRRWQGVEELCHHLGKEPHQLSTQELNELWDQVKAAEKDAPSRA